MDLSLVSLIISIVGLALGFISAQAHLRSFVTSVAEGRDSFSRTFHEKRTAAASLFLAYPSALLAHAGRITLAAFFLFFLASPVATALVRQYATDYFSWMGPVVGLSIGAVVGVLLGSLHATLGDVIKAARNHEQARSISSYSGDLDSSA